MCFVIDFDITKANRFVAIKVEKVRAAILDSKSFNINFSI